MPGIWEALRDFRNPCSVLTKSPLLLRDLDLMLEIAAGAPTSTRTCRSRRWTRSPGGRASRTRRTRASGSRRWPSSTGRDPDGRPDRAADAGDQRRARAGRGDPARRAADAGATSIGGIALHLRGEVRGVFMEWLRCYRPDLVSATRSSTRAAPTCRASESDRIAAARCARAPRRDPATRLARQADARRHASAAGRAVQV